MSEIVNPSVGGTLPLGKERNIMFCKQVDQASIEDITKKILDVNENDRYLEQLYPIYGLVYTPPPISIYIDSYGGNVYQIMGLLGIVERSKTPVHTIVTGAAMSCGFMLLIFGHKRFAYQYATPLYHQVSSGIWGKVRDMEEDVAEAKRLQKLFEDLTLKKTKITAKQLEKIYKRKIDWYMTPEEAKKLGVVDVIL